MGIIKSTIPETEFKKAHAKSRQFERELMDAVARSVAFALDNRSNGGNWALDAYNKARSRFGKEYAADYEKIVEWYNFGCNAVEVDAAYKQRGLIQFEDRITSDILRKFECYVSDEILKELYVQSTLRGYADKTYIL